MRVVSAWFPIVHWWQHSACAEWQICSNLWAWRQTQCAMVFRIYTFTGNQFCPPLHNQCHPEIPRYKLYFECLAILIAIFLFIAAAVWTSPAWRLIFWIQRKPTINTIAVLKQSMERRISRGKQHLISDSGCENEAIVLKCTVEKHKNANAYVFGTKTQW